MSKRCQLQKEYYQANGNYKGSGKYSDDYVMWLENEVLAWRQPIVIKSVGKCKGGAVGNFHFERGYKGETKVLMGNYDENF